jgi:amidophosphoribosyltransferase
MNLLLQKMRNRGQDGAGLATVKLYPRPGHRFISRKRSIAENYLKDLFDQVYKYFRDLPEHHLADTEWLKANLPYTGEILLGHLRYGTHDSNTVETCHPFLRQNNWITRNLVLAGNFNMTNADELFKNLLEIGQFPKEKADTVTVLEKIGHFLDEQVEGLYTKFKKAGHQNPEINQRIFDELNVLDILQKSTKKFDGGYVIAGIFGHGDSFVMRDKNGIRPAYFYRDDEIVVCASERPTIQTAFNLHHSRIEELPPAHALIIKHNGKTSLQPYTEPGDKRSCSFERIYFSRGSDYNIYKERKSLGRNLRDRILKKINADLDNTVFTYVPNTAETAFMGLMESLQEYASGEGLQVRGEKLIVKDAKMRTFIADDDSRAALVSHVYDVTYGIVRDYKDTLVVLDDSIVRGTTMRDSIITMLSRLNPRRIVVVSSAPQIRYPDCYGIDMSKIQKFIAFNALENLLRQDGKEDEIEKTYYKCLSAIEQERQINCVQELYDHYTEDEISDEIASILTPKELDVAVDVIYQSLEGLHAACPKHRGDWYFSGNYPTPGGIRVVNRSFVNYYEKKDIRAY